MPKQLLTLIGLVGYASSLPVGAQTWDFTAGTQNWQIVDRLGSRNDGYVNVGDVTYAPDWAATGGDPNGYISHIDPSQFTFFFVSPSALGDYSAYQGGTLNFSLNYDSPITWTADNYVILRSGVGTLFSQITFPPQNAWNNYSIALEAASFLDLGFNSITPGTLTAVLANLDTVEISGEYTASPPYETASLDSVSFQPVPEPAVVPLALAGLAALGVFRRRQG